MVENPVILTCESPHLSRFMGLSHKPTSNFGYLTRIPANPVQIAAFRSSSSRSYRNPIALSSFKELGRSDIGFRQLGYDWFRPFQMMAPAEVVAMVVVSVMENLVAAVVVMRESGHCFHGI